jgi:hypothetical protein
MPDTRREQWNIATGMRLLFSETTQLEMTSSVAVSKSELYNIHSSEQPSDTNLPSFLECKPNIKVD